MRSASRFQSLFNFAFAMLISLAIAVSGGNALAERVADLAEEVDRLSEVDFDRIEQTPGQHNLSPIIQRLKNVPSINSAQPSLTAHSRSSTTLSVSTPVDNPPIHSLSPGTWRWPRTLRRSTSSSSTCW